MLLALCAGAWPGAAVAGPGTVLVVNLRSGERARLDPERLPAPPALARFLRCARDRAYTRVDPRPLWVALRAARDLGAGRVEIVSAFRTRRVNAALRARGHAVARRSRHTAGQALDFRLRGVSVRRLCRYLRRRHPGGVGCYLRQRFVHVDTGPRRRWSG